MASTDCGEPCIYPSLLWRDICLLHERGLGRMDAIKAATSRAATLLGVEATVGTIAVGMQADLILVAGNPAEDLACLADVRLVMKSGEVVHTR